MLKSPPLNGSGPRINGSRHNRLRTQSETGVPRRNNLLRLGLAALLGVCLLRLVAEAWQRSGRNIYFLSAFAARSSRHGLDSAMFYSVDTPPAPIDSVLTSDVVYGASPGT